MPEKPADEEDDGVGSEEEDDDDDDDGGGDEEEGGITEIRFVPGDKAACESFLHFFYLKTPIIISISFLWRCYKASGGFFFFFFRQNYVTVHMYNVHMS